MALVVFSIVLLISSEWYVSGFYHSRYVRRFRLESFHEPIEHWFVQKVNHFNVADGRVWNQRFYINDTYYKPGSPVFLMIGGEGALNPTWMEHGTWLTYAKKLNALCIFLEHRFYGKSWPTQDLSTANLHYLRSSQALADLAHFRNMMGVKMNLTLNKWIAFGGSYPGTLAAWFRLKYPHLVYGAVATSAPMRAVINFTEYLEVVSNALAAYSPQCPLLVKNASDSLVKMLKKHSSIKKISKDFKLCERLKIRSYMDSSYFLEALAGNFMDVVQYNEDNRIFEVSAAGTNITIQVLCDIMANSSLGVPYKRYAAIVQMMLQIYDEKCLDTSYSKFLQDMSNITWTGLAADGNRQWEYQSCAEFGFFQSADSILQPFSGFSRRYKLQQCVDIFGPKFNASAVANAIQQTNECYGGLNIKSSRIVFPTGSMDPWHILSITKNLSVDVPAIYIQGTAHCANMYPARSEDLPQLTRAREEILQLLQNWLK
uniref:Serine protease 59, putative n=1 Tax=Callorhinchus milii TaxID=7868 RepID=A0A4W3KCS1_CALMI